MLDGEMMKILSQIADCQSLILDLENTIQLIVRC